MLPNIITTIRIGLSIALLFTDALSGAFYICYLAAGFSDMLDGFAARKLKLCSDFGARLDTIADIIFFLATAYKVLPQANLSKGIWIWIGVIALIKFANITKEYIKQKKLLSVHSILNKTTGFLLFIFPFTLATTDIRYSSITICIIATLAALQESQHVANNE